MFLTVSATTPRSCVMSISAAPVRSWTSRISSRIWAWIVTSSAVVGSSAMSSLGSHDNAIAIITRWRMPPDSSCGYCLTRRSGLLIPTARIDSIALSQAAFLDSLWCWMTASEIWSPTVNTGLRLVIGSWKIMAMSLPRTWRIASSESSSRLRPSNRISPVGISAGGMSSRRMIESDVTLLPQPDAPTMPRVSPGGIEKLTPSTARTTPSMTWKYVRRSRTSSSGRLYDDGAGSSAAVGTIVNRLLPRSRVERVAKTVAQEVDGADGQGDGHAREECPPPVAEDLGVLGVREGVAPADVGRLEPEVQEAHERLGHD